MDNKWIISCLDKKPVYTKLIDKIRILFGIKKQKYLYYVIKYNDKTGLWYKKRISKKLYFDFGGKL